MSELTPQSTAPRPHSIGRKRMRFSLRLLLVVVSLAAVLLGVMAAPLATARREDQIAQYFEDVGARVSMHFVPEGKLHELLFSWGLKRPYRRIKWLILNPDRDHDSLKVIESNISLEPLSELKHLDFLSCRGCGLDDEDLAQIARCGPSVQDIDIRSNPKVTDEGFGKLAGRFDRARLTVSGTSVTNNCLRTVASTFGFSDGEVDAIVRERIGAEFKFEDYYLGPVKKLSLPWGGRWCEVKESLPANTICIATDPDGFLTNAIDFMVAGLENEDLWFQLSAEHIASETIEQLKRLDTRLKLLAVLADGMSVEDLLDLFGELPQLETLLILDAESGGDMSKLAGVDSLRELGILDTKVSDKDILSVKDLKTLQTLRIPDALVTSAGITALSEGRKEPFELLHLPASFSDIKPSLIANGIAKEVEVSSGLGYLAEMWTSKLPWDEVRERMDSLLELAEFPRPDDSPWRPEDHNVSFYASLVKRHASELLRKGESDSAVQAISNFLQKYATEAPIERAVQEFRESPNAETPVTEVPVGTSLWPILAQAHRRLGNHELAFEYHARPWLQHRRKRKHAEWIRFYREAARFALAAPDSDKMRLVKDALFLTVTKPTRFEKSPTRMAYQSDWCPVLAPPGFKVESIETHFASEERAKSQIQQFISERDFAMVSSRSFPCTIKISLVK